MKTVQLIFRFSYQVFITKKIIAQTNNRVLCFSNNHCFCYMIRILTAVQVSNTSRVLRGKRQLEERSGRAKTSTVTPSFNFSY